MGGSELKRAAEVAWARVREMRRREEAEASAKVLAEHDMEGGDERDEACEPRGGASREGGELRGGGAGSDAVECEHGCGGDGDTGDQPRAADDTELEARGSGTQDDHLMPCGMPDRSQEREAYHNHECPVCGAYWIHGSRQCRVSELEARCMNCAEESSTSVGREEIEMSGGPGNIEEPAEEAPAPQEEPKERDDGDAGDDAEVK